MTGMSEEHPELGSIGCPVWDDAVEPVHRFTRKVLGDTEAAGEAASETFVALLEKSRTGFRPKRPISYALKVAWRKCCAQPRPVSRAAPELLATPAWDPAHVSAIRDWLHSALEVLDEDDRVVIHLRYSEELNYSGIAEVLGVSVPTAHRRVGSATALLQATLERLSDQRLARRMPVLLALLAGNTSGAATTSALVAAGASAIGGARVVRLSALVTGLAALVVVGLCFLLSGQPWEREPYDQIEGARPAIESRSRREETARTVGAVASVPYEEARGRAIEGTVRFEDGGPASGASVWVFDAMDRRLRDLTSGDVKPDCVTGAEGRFEVRPPRGAETVQIVVMQPGWPPALKETVQLTEKNCVVTVPRGMALEGAVLGSAGEVGAGACVEYQAFYPTFVWSRSVMADERGRYRLTGLPRSQGWPVGSLRVTRRGYAPRVMSVSAGGVGAVPLRSGSARCNVVLTRGSSMVGTVVDAETGEAVIGARVSVAAFNAPRAPVVWSDYLLEPLPGLTATSDANGRFSISHRPSSDSADNVLLLVERDGYARLAARVGSAEERTFALRPVGTVTGTVVDQEGRPVEDARVVASDRSDLGRWWLRAPHGPLGSFCVGTTDRRGRFVMEGVPSSAQGTVVNVAAAHRLDTTYLRETVVVTGGTSALGEIPLLTQSVEIRKPWIVRQSEVVLGAVRSDAGTPLAGVSVRSDKAGELVGPSATRTDAHGKFEVALLEKAVLLRDSAFLRASLPGYGTRRVIRPFLELVGTELEIVLSPGRELRGRVLDDRGRPVSDAWVRVSEARWRGLEGAKPLAATMTGADGRFELRDLPDELLDLAVEHLKPGPSGRESVWTRWINGENVSTVVERHEATLLRDVRAGEERDIVVHLRDIHRAGSIEVVVAGASSMEGYGGAWEARVVGGRGSRARAKGLPDGTARLPFVPVGPQTVEVTCPGRVAVRGTVMVHEGECARLTLNPVPGATFSGLVGFENALLDRERTTESGTGVRVRVFRLADGFLQGVAPVGRFRRFEIRGLTAGRWMAVASNHASGGTLATVRPVMFEVAEGQARVVRDLKVETAHLLRFEVPPSGVPGNGDLPVVTVRRTDGTFAYVGPALPSPAVAFGVSAWVAVRAGTYDVSLAMGGATVFERRVGVDRDVRLRATAPPSGQRRVAAR